VYKGRFAPSPSGPLHHGSLLAALASYLDTKAHRGRWILRIEDVDELRTVPGSEHAILHALEAHGLHWDEQAPNQSTRKNRYSEILNQLAQTKCLFACDCPRKMLRELGGIYPGNCRSKTLSAGADAKPLEGSASIRFNSSLADKHIVFADRIQGTKHYTLSDLGDFIVKRRDGLFAYQLAVVIDDQDQGITDILRGTDLLDSTPWQIVLQQALGFRRCRYTHIPVLLSNNVKLSKQTGANAVDTSDTACRRNLIWALEMLGQPLPEAEIPALDDILTFAIERWDANKIPRNETLPEANLLP